MPHFDLPLPKLRSYNPPEQPPRDFHAFWQRTLAQTSAAGPVAPHFIQLPDPIYHTVDVYDVTFHGYLAQPIKAWFILPAGTDHPLPCLISFIGYSGGRGLPLEHLTPAAAGFAHFIMDSRGQGSSVGAGSVGDTPDIAPPEGSGPQAAGFMSRGILHPGTYYYRRVFTDAVRAVEAAARHPLVDPSRLAVTGASQGGGIALAAAALSPLPLKLLMADVPFLCHFTRATTLVDTWPYNEIVAYLKAHRDQTDTVFRTLAYFDGLHFAPRIRARTLFSVGLMDNTCPPSTIFAAYNRIKAKKEIRIYPFNTHEGGGPFQVAERLRFAARYL